MSNFKKAVRAAVKVRIALAGPSGSGKTYTALTWAHALGKQIAYVDTERGSASTYAGVNGWEFDVVEPETFDPGNLAGLLREAGAAGYDVVVIDSLSHYWNGQGGMLELSEKLQTGNNKFSGWAKAGEREKQMLDALLGFPGHVIVTMRTKTDTVVETKENGRAGSRVVTLKPIQRDGIEYEFGIVGELDQSNTLTVTKSRIAPIQVGDTFDKPGSSVALTISDYLANGEELPKPQEYADRALSATSRKDLLVLLDEVHRAGYDGAGVQDADGETVGLKVLIVNAGKALSA